MDCANGAASVAAPMALQAAGAEVVVIGAEPMVPVMVEAPTDEQARQVAGRLADVVCQRLWLG